MPIFSVDITDTYEDLWDAGLARLIDSRADAAVTVDGLDALIFGPSPPSDATAGWSSTSAGTTNRSARSW